MPSPLPPRTYQPITLTGRVTDRATNAPIAGAVVSINGRYQSNSDEAGNFRIEGLLDYGQDFTWASAPGYETDYRFIRGTHKLSAWIEYGESTPVRRRPFQ